MGIKKWESVTAVIDIRQEALCHRDPMCRIDPCRMQRLRDRMGRRRIQPWHLVIERRLRVGAVDSCTVTGSKNMHNQPLMPPPRQQMIPYLGPALVPEGLEAH